MDELKVVESGSLNVIPVTEYDPFEVCTFYFVHATFVKLKKIRLDISWFLSSDVLFMNNLQIVHAFMSKARGHLMV